MSGHSRHNPWPLQALFDATIYAVLLFTLALLGWGIATIVRFIF